MTDAITVRIPTALRPQTGNHDTVAVAGQTVGQVLTNLTTQYPELGKRLYKNPDANEVNRFINIYVNDEDIRFLENQETPVKAGDELAIVPAIAGG